MLNLAVEYAALISGNLEAETDRVKFQYNVEIQVWFTKRCYYLPYILYTPEPHINRRHQN